MITHIVFWKLKEVYETSSKAEIAAEIKNRLEALCPIIKEIQSLEVGINTNTSDAAYDVALYSTFDSMKDLETYQNHGEHQKIVSYVKSVVTDRKVVDYEK